MKQNPCMNCGVRFEACHDICLNYQEWSEYNKALRKKKRLNGLMANAVAVSASVILRQKNNGKRHYSFRGGYSRGQ